MLTKQETSAAWELALKQRQNDENDTRNLIRQVPVDFAIECVQTAVKPLKKVMANTVQALIAMSNDPMLQKDQRAQIKQLIEINRNVLIELEVSNA